MEKNVSQKLVERMDNDWFIDEVSRIRIQDYVGTKFYAVRLLKLDAGRGDDLYYHVIVPVDEFYVAYRDMGFEVINLKVLKKLLPAGLDPSRCDLQLDTGRTKIDGQLDALMLESKPLHDHLESLYN